MQAPQVIRKKRFLRRKLDKYEYQRLRPPRRRRRGFAGCLHWDDRLGMIGSVPHCRWSLCYDDL